MLIIRIRNFAVSVVVCDNVDGYNAVLHQRLKWSNPGQRTMSQKENSASGLFLENWGIY